MAPKEPPSAALGRAYGRAALGLRFAGGVIVFTGAGFALDRWLGLLPVFTVAGALIGATLGFLSVFYQIKAEDEARRRKRDADRVR